MIVSGQAREAACDAVAPTGRYQNPDKTMTLLRFSLLALRHRQIVVLKAHASGVRSAERACAARRREIAFEKFNAEHANKQFVFVDELVPNEKTGSLADALAPKIVGGNIWIERKGVDRFQAADAFNIMAVEHP